MIYKFSNDQFEFFSKETVEGWVRNFYETIIKVENYIYGIISFEKNGETIFVNFCDKLI